MKYNYQNCLAMKFPLTFLFSCFLILVYGQNLQIVSDLDWLVSDDEGVNYDLTPKNVSDCVDEAHIDEICGQAYPSPQLATHFAGCDDMVPIWGVASPDNCSFIGDIYWFKTTFSLGDEEFSGLLSANVRIQADNSFDLYLNDELIGESNNTEWFQVFEYSPIDYLVEGENEIKVRVNNQNGGTCFNYAFLAFCLDITYDEVLSLDDQSSVAQQIQVFPNPTADFINVSSLDPVHTIRDLQVFNTLGELVYIHTMTNQSQVSIPVAEWASNLYILQFMLGDQMIRWRVIVD